MYAPSTEYDFELALDERSGIAREWIVDPDTSNETRYIATSRRRKHDVPNLCEVPIESCNVLARGFDLETRDRRSVLGPVRVRRRGCPRGSVVGG